jgi:hypothetical protein
MRATPTGIAQALASPAHRVLIVADESMVAMLIETLSPSSDIR